MFYVVLAIAFSVAVSILLKLARRGQVDMVQAVATNYVVAAALAWLLLDARPQAAMAASDTYAPLLLLGVLLPAIFLVLARSIRSAGIVRTDVAQRLSLVIPLIAAFALLGEVATGRKLLGVTLALVAVVCVLWRRYRGDLDPRAAGLRREPATWLAPLAVFAGFGVIDLCFKLLAKAGAPFASALLVSFLIAMVLCWLVVVGRAIAGAAALSWRSIGFGIVLGAANFANILFYVRAHIALPNDPSLVFAAMNVGVMVLGALVGALAFREKLSWINWGGLVMALAAIAVMTG
ncbi:EamA/RhaT family transporter [Luteibacter sp. ME-Dv--P-043b]|uniref:EamA family transporter n=1 Tax=Luteibacter sp. ME-Dv--P-043b TaxID=3040291 RepID=UPI00255429C5|nr:EamA/RhaT family transporter [Luteibacter sp. ME-Dv--P-043b]